MASMSRVVLLAGLVGMVALMSTLVEATHTTHVPRNRVHQSGDKYAAGQAALEAAKLFDRVVFNDTFQEFDLRRWKHEITASGGG